jgi:hypothetical protein
MTFTTTAEDLFARQHCQITSTYDPRIGQMSLRIGF